MNLTRKKMLVLWAPLFLIFALPTFAGIPKRTMADSAAECAAGDKSSCAFMEVLANARQASDKDRLDAIHYLKNVKVLRQLIEEPKQKKKIAEAAQARLAELEDAAWRLATASGQYVPYAEYVANFPSGPHATEAAQRKQAIEEVDWKRTRELDSEEAYREHQRTHPESAHAAEIDRRLDELAWSKAKAAGTYNSAHEYLENGGKLVDEARKLQADILRAAPVLSAEQMKQKFAEVTEIIAPFEIAELFREVSAAPPPLNGPIQVQVFGGDHSSRVEKSGEGILRVELTRDKPGLRWPILAIVIARHGVQVGRSTGMLEMKHPMVTFTSYHPETVRQGGVPFDEVWVRRSESDVDVLVWTKDGWKVTKAH